MGRWFVAALLLGLPAGGASAQATQCDLPDRLPPVASRSTPDERQRRITPITRYTLALSWSPEHCRDVAGDPAHAFQCKPGRGGPRFGFILHGLWPDGSTGKWPQYCRSAGHVSAAEMRRMLCVMPSTTLIQHEWEKHGSCMARTPEHYFTITRRLHARIRYPDMNALSRRRDLTASAFAQSFADANPGMTPAMLRVQADRKGWLEEVLVCLDLKGHPRTCRANDNGAAAASPLRIWRGR